MIDETKEIIAPRDVLLVYENWNNSGICVVSKEFLHSKIRYALAYKIDNICYANHYSLKDFKGRGRAIHLIGERKGQTEQFEFEAETFDYEDDFFGTRHARCLTSMKLGKESILTMHWNASLNGNIDITNYNYKNNDDEVINRFNTKINLLEENKKYSMQEIDSIISVHNKKMEEYDKQTKKQREQEEKDINEYMKLF